MVRRKIVFLLVFEMLLGVVLNLSTSSNTILEEKQVFTVSRTTASLDLPVEVLEMREEGISDVVMPINVSAGVLSAREDKMERLINETDIQKVFFDEADFNEPVIYDDCHVTAYCNCESCCGQYAGKRTTSIGATVVEGVTIAVDPSIIPYGSVVELDGHLYLAQDCGGAIDGIEIDVYIEDTGKPHTRCKEFMRNLSSATGNVIKVWTPKN